jgi:hypothetical protein
LVEPMVASVPPVRTPASGALLEAEPGKITLALPSWGTITRSPGISACDPFTGICTPSRITMVPAVASVIEPMPRASGAIPATTGATPPDMTGVCPLCATTTGATLLSLARAEEEFELSATAIGPPRE